MVDNVNNDIIKIDILLFREKLNELEKEEILDISENIKRKYNELIKNYNCFNTKYDPKSVWEKKKYKTRTLLLNNKNKLYTFTIGTNDNNRKSFIGLLNKITDNNKNTILNNINIILENNKNITELFKIIFNYIDKKYEYIYILILKEFEKKEEDIIYNYIYEYINNKLWLPYDFILKNNILDDKLYDEYCLYIKWKIKQLNYIKTFEYIMRENKDKYIKLYNILCNNLHDEFNKYLNSNIYRYILDYILELFQILLNNDYKDNDIINNLKELDITNLDNSTKFLIYNIIKK